MIEGPERYNVKLRTQSLIECGQSRQGGDRGCAARLSTMLVVAVMSFVIVLIATIGASRAIASQSDSVEGLGSVDDYMQSNPDFADAYRVPLLGIEVANGAGTLDDGYPFDGIEILRVTPGSPGAAAGLQGREVHVHAALTVGLLAASMFFPPAMIGVAALDSSGVGEFHELIIAVDGRRTRNVTAFDDALSQARAGEAVYLTVVSSGKRRQITVELPARHQ
jgi:S1-C subfamily serine protease